MRTYKDLVAWQRSVELALEIYRITDTFPRREQYGLTAQMREAATSVPSNVAEGQGRMSTGETLQFLGHSRGSLYELGTQVVIATRLGYVTPEESRAVERSITRTGAALAGFITFIKLRKARERKDASVGISAKSSA